MEVLGNISYVEFDEILEENQDVLERVKNNSVIHWHDLKKNPNDLPDSNKCYLIKTDEFPKDSPYVVASFCTDNKKFYSEFTA